MTVRYWYPVAAAMLSVAVAHPMMAPLLMVNPTDDRSDLIPKGLFFGELYHPATFAAASCAAQTVKLLLGSIGGGIQFAVADIPIQFLLGLVFRFAR